MWPRTTWEPNVPASTAPRLDTGTARQPMRGEERMIDSVSTAFGEGSVFTPMLGCDFVLTRSKTLCIEQDNRKAKGFLGRLKTDYAIGVRR